MQVTALRDHANQFGRKYQKVRGDEYLHPHPAGDIASGIVAESGSDKAQKAVEDKAKKAAEEATAAKAEKAAAKSKSTSGK